MSAVTINVAAQPGELRLTPRGRRVLVLLVTVVLGVLALIGAQAVAADSPGVGLAVDTYTVGAGESLWSIATGYTPPGGDVRETVAELTRLNGLADSGIDAGQTLLVPVSR